MRDFVYLKDLVQFLCSLMDSPIKNGIYNFGTGRARSFNDLVSAVFKSMAVRKKVTYIDMPAKIKDRYQYWTQAEMNKLLGERPNLTFHSLEEGIDDYVKFIPYPEEDIIKDQLQNRY